MISKLLQRHIANKINELIRDRSLSLRELSKLSGISIGYLSKITQCKVNPTIGILQNIATAVDEHIAFFFEGYGELKENISLHSQIKSPTYICILSVGDKRIVTARSGVAQYNSIELAGNINLADSLQVSIAKITDSIYRVLEIDESRRDSLQIKDCRLFISVQCYEFLLAKNKLRDHCLRLFHSVKFFADWQVGQFASFHGSEGMSIVVDKGMSISYRYNNELRKVGGWGFPHDVAGEVWIGLQAAKHALRVIDGFEEPSKLAQEIITKFDRNPELLIEHCASANASAYVELSKLVLNYVARNDIYAISIIDKGYQCLQEIIKVIDARTGSQNSKIALYGSMADIYAPYISIARLMPAVSGVEQCRMLEQMSLEEENFV